MQAALEVCSADQLVSDVHLQQQKAVLEIILFLQRYDRQLAEG